ncbi:MAG: hypothetical protein LBJ01_03475 [Tannerella sp.]|jgi:hypothetical protein|nr:hypothetical protein [Tannerella sp.]
MKKKMLFVGLMALACAGTVSAQNPEDAGYLRIEQPGTVRILHVMQGYCLFENKGGLPDQKHYWEPGRKNYLGLVNAFANPDASTVLYLDTAFVNRGPENARPQYMLAVGVEKVETQAGVQGYVRGRYLINASDSALHDDGSENPDYVWDRGWTRLVFTDAVHANDALYILSGADLAAENAYLPGTGRTVDVSKLDGLAETGKIHKIALDDDQYKMCTFSFRLVETGASECLIQSEQFGYTGSVNGVPVIIRTFDFDYIREAGLFFLETVEGGEAVGHETVAEPVRIHAANGVLTVQSPVAEEITVYAISGAPMYRAQKAAGVATFGLNRLPQGVYIVRGSSGWVKKIAV